MIDEETWNDFKIFVSSRYGSLRTTRLAVEKALKRVKTLETVKEFSEAMGFVNSVCPSVREVEERRPKIRTSAGEEVRGLRNEREAVKTSVTFGSACATDCMESSSLVKA